MNASTHEWLKIVLSTVAGMLAGLIAEPFRSWIQNRMMALRIRRILHRELVRLEGQFSMGSALTEPKDIERASQNLAAFTLDAYEHYFETQRGLFYADERLSEMRSVFESLKGLLQDPLRGARTYHDTRHWGMGLIADAITLRIFDHKLIERCRKTQHNFQVSMVFAGIGTLTSEDRWPPRIKLSDRIKRRFSPDANG